MALVVVIVPAVPVVTEVGAVALVLAVTAAVSVVEVSVMVSVAAAEPVVRVAVADVLDVTVGVPMLAPVPPDSLNRPAAVSVVHSVFVPVRVTVGVVLVLPELGAIPSVAV